MRWVGFYLLHLLAATFGVMLATAILLNGILKPLLEPGISDAKLISIAAGPYYPLPIVLAALAGYFGYFGHTRIRGSYCFWVWIVPTAYLVTKIFLWTPTSVLADQNWDTTLAHFFVGTRLPVTPKGMSPYPFTHLWRTHWGHYWTPATCFVSSIRVRVLALSGASSFCFLSTGEKSP
jgi:hypothetical protein